MTDPWAIRNNRARNLAAERPHARDLLTFYSHVLANQRIVFDAVKGTDGLLDVIKTDEEPWLSLPSLQLDALTDLFASLVESLRPHAPAVTAHAGEALLSIGPHPVLAWFVSGAKGPTPVSHEFNQTQLEFYPRTFVQAVLQIVTEELEPDRIPANKTSCPVCGALPQLSVLQDEPGALGQRRLLCSLCLAMWRFPRVMCPGCGESSSAKLFRHDQEANHVSVDECTTCRRYLKSVDLRKNGRAEPVVDEIATIELDLWAAGRKLTKIRSNLLGF